MFGAIENKLGGMLRSLCREEGVLSQRTAQQAFGDFGRDTLLNSKSQNVARRVQELVFQAGNAAREGRGEQAELLFNQAIGLPGVADTPLASEHWLQLVDEALRHNLPDTAAVALTNLPASRPEAIAAARQALGAGHDLAATAYLRKVLGEEADATLRELGGSTAATAPKAVTRASAEVAALTQLAREAMDSAPTTAMETLGKALGRGKSLGDALEVANVCNKYVATTHSGYAFNTMRQSFVPRFQQLAMRAVEQASALAKTPAEVRAVLECTGQQAVSVLAGEGNKLALLPWYKLPVEELLTRATRTMVKTQADALELAKLIVSHDYRERLGGLVEELLPALTPDQVKQVAEVAIKNGDEGVARRLVERAGALTEVERMALKARIETRYGSSRPPMPSYPGRTDVRHRP